MTDADPWPGGTASSRSETDEKILDTAGGDREGDGDKTPSQSQPPKRNLKTKLSVYFSSLSVDNNEKDKLFTENHFPSEPPANTRKPNDDAMVDHLQGQLTRDPYTPLDRNTNIVVLHLLEAYRNLRSAMKPGTASSRDGGDQREADKKGANPESVKDEEIRKLREQLKEANEKLRKHSIAVSKGLEDPSPEPDNAPTGDLTESSASEIAATPGPRKGERRGMSSKNKGQSNRGRAVNADFADRLKHTSQNRRQQGNQ